MNSSNVSATASEQEENALQALGEGGQVLDPPKIAFPTRGLFRAVGLSWDAQRPVTVVGAGTPAERGPMRLREAVAGASWQGGTGCSGGDPFVRRAAPGGPACSTLQL